MPPRKSRTKEAPVPRKRRRRRTRKQMDIATAKGAIKNIFAAEDVQTYDELSARLASVQADIAARISIVNERWTRDGEELSKLKQIEIINIIK